MERYDRHAWCRGKVTGVLLSAAAGIHVGLDALADLPLAKLRKQLDVNLIAQVSVTQARQSLLSSTTHKGLLIPYAKEATARSWRMQC